MGEGNEFSSTFGPWGWLSEAQARRCRSVAGSARPTRSGRLVADGGSDIDGGHLAINGGQHMD